MNTAAMIRDAAPSPVRALWCVGTNPNCMSVLIEKGDVVAAAALLDKVAKLRKLAIVEVCRVKQGTREAAYARLEPKANPT